jgi:cytochrome b pre-mRNA-processing protein 3
MLYLFTKQGRLSRRQAKELYKIVISHARNPVFYSEFNVPDTMEGRFEMVTLHGGLLVNYLCRPEMGIEGRKLAQAFFDEMFKSIDLSIREMGVGDLAVPRRIKKMMTNFKGRAFAYDEATKVNINEIIHALSRNIYKNEKPSEQVIQKFAEYVQLCVIELEKQSLSDFWQGKVRFPAIYPSNGFINATQAA